MEDFTEKDSFGHIIRSFTSKGFLSLKKLCDFVFPSKEETPPDTFKGKWMRVISYTAPIAAILILLGIFIGGWAWAAHFEEGAFMFVLHLLVCVIGVFYMGMLFLLSFILKLKKRNPAVLLGLTVIFPLRAVAWLFFINLLFLICIPHYPISKSKAKVEEQALKNPRRFLSLRDKVRREESATFNSLYEKTHKSPIKTLDAKGEQSISTHEIIEELFQASLKKGQEDMKQMQENYAQSVEKRRQEHASRGVDFGKHCVLLGKIGEHVDTSEATTTPPKEAEISEQPTELNIPLFFGWDKAPYDTVQANSDE